MRHKNRITLVMKTEYVISSETIVILPDYNENGYLHSLLCTKDGFSKVGLSPYNLIDTNLRFRGSSMRGALEGAQAILGKMNMNPLILDQEQGIILFPCRSPQREDCVWLSLQHVKQYKTAGKTRTRVELSNGSTIIIDVSKLTFEKKMQRAYELRFKMQAQRMQFEGKVMESGVTYHLIRKRDGGNYEDGVLVE